MKKILKQEIQRFELKFERAPSGCWEWNAGLVDTGYGAFSFRGKNIPSHRFSYMAYVGQIRNKLFVCHTCDNRKCVNPSHLFLGTHTDNMRDKTLKGRGNQPKGESVWLAKLTEAEVSKMRTLYLTKRYTQKKLSEMFGIAQQNISLAVRGKTWAHITN